MATPVIIEVKANTSQAKREFDSFGASLKSFGAGVRSVIAMSSQAVTGIRQMAQGVQNLGFTMSAMIGLPLAGTLKKVAEEATEFEKRLVEVEKTTGLAKEEVADIGDEIRELAMHTPTAAKELAGLAAEAGRAGVGLGNTLAGNIEGAKAEIIEFVRVMDMMQVATTLDSEEAAKAFSRFITLFDEIDTTNIENLGSAINELGQATSVSEDDIVGAMLRIAPAASTLGMSAAEVAGLATAITQMSESMSRGGTRVRVALEQMTLKYEKAAELIGISSQEMAKRLNEDALPVFMEVVYAVSQIEDATESTAVAAEIFGTSGANAVKRFAAAYPELQKLMELSNQAFEDGTSLQVEFDRALTATSAQFDILKNAIMEAGYTFTQDLLPVAQEIISALIPAVQELTQWIGGLTTEQKMLAVALVGVVTVGLPLLALLGSLGFGISMIINGAVNLIGGLLGLVATIATFGGGISLLTTLLGGLAVMFGSVFVVKLMKANDSFDTILAKLREVAGGAIDWGENLIANIAEGIVQAAATVLVRALEFVGNIVSSYLEGHSPPDTGPLSSINEWGSRLIDTYLQGFYNADFGVLKKVAGIIASVFENLVSIGDIEEIDLGPMLAEARTQIAKLISVFNETGVISETVLSKIESMLGGAGDEVADLLRLQLTYNKALKDLEAIRNKTSDIEEAYQAEARAIAARTDLTEAEKMQAIRSAKKRRDLALTNAKTEQRVAEDNVDSLKDQVSWQENYIGAMADQDSVMIQHLSVLKKLKKVITNTGKAIKSLAQKIQDLINDLLRQLEVNEMLKALYEDKGMDTTPLLRKELSLRKRLVAALLEKKLEQGELSEQEEQMLNANLDRIAELEAALDIDTSSIISPVDTDDWDSGNSAIQETIGKIAELGGTITSTLEKGKSLWEAFKSGLTGELGIGEPMTTMPGSFKPGQMDFGKQFGEFGPVVDESAQKFFEWGQKIKEAWDKVKGIFNDIKTRFQGFKDTVKGAFGEIETTVKSTGLGDATSEFGDKFKLYAPAIAAFAASLFLLRKPLLGLATWFTSPAIIGALGDKLSKFAAKDGPLGRLIDFSRSRWPKAAGAGSKAASTFGNAIKGIASKFTWVPIVNKNVTGLTAAGGPMPKLSLWAGKIWPKMSQIGRSAASNFIYAFQTIGGKLRNARQSVSFFAKGVKLSMLEMVKYPKETAKIFGGKLFGALKGFFSLAKGGFVGLITSLGSAMTSIGTFIGSITMIGGVVIAVIAAIGAAVWYIKENWATFEEKFKQIWSNITDAVKGFVDNFKQALGLGGAGGEGLKFGDILGFIYEKAKPVAKFLAGAFTKALQIISGLLKIILPALGKAFGGIFRGIGMVAAGVLDLLGGIFEVIEGIWKGISEGDWSMLKDAWEKIKTGVLEVLGGLGTAIGSVFLSIGDTILGIVRSIIDGIGNLFGFNNIVGKVSKAVDDIIYFFKKLWKKLVGGSIVPDIVNGIKAWFKKLTKPFQPVIDTIKRLVKYFKLAAKFVGNAFKAGGMKSGLLALYKVLGPLREVFRPVIELVWRFWQIIKPLAEALKSGFKEGGIKGAFEALKAILPSILPMIGKLIGDMMTMVPKMLIALGQMLWPWITGTLIPWVTSVVATAWEYLKTNVPIWITAILTVLGELAGKLWTWITETLIPWVVELIGKVWTFIKENAPGWISALLDVLATIGTKLWEFITQTLIPWAIDLIGKVIDIIKEKGPGWLEKLGEILVTIATALWEFITNDLIPWIVDVIKTVADYIVTNGPKWLAKLAVVLRSLAVKLWNWITTTVVPWLRDIINKGKTWLGKIATEWWEKVKTGLDKIKNKFRTIFDTIKAIITTTLKGAFNKLLGSLEKGINNVVEGINKFIDTINKVVTALGFDPLKHLGKVHIPRLAKGGIALQEQLAIVGDVPEAIIPLDRLPELFGARDNTPNVSIVIKDNNVRNDEDIQRIVDQVSYKLGLQLGYKAKNLGRAIG